METTTLERMLCLPADDVLALSHGKLICAIPRVQIQPGVGFFLYPMSSNANEVTTLDSWATCEQSTMLNEEEHLQCLAKLTGWEENFLQQEFQSRGCLFISYLRVYHLPELIQVPTSVSADKVGKFVGLSSLYPTDKTVAPTVKVKPLLPLVSGAKFLQRKRQIEEMRPPEHPELEKLHDYLNQLAPLNLLVEDLNQSLECFLGWRSVVDIYSDPDLSWIDKITSVGNSSDGNEFEKSVRKSCIKLGFGNSLNNIRASLDPTATGGAGGIDVYCDTPFSLVGECKATKNESVSNGVSAQLINLGVTHLGKIVFNQSVKVIFAAGKLTSAAEKAAFENQMNVMTPETLQRLVTLQSQHPGSIDLKNFETCLRTGTFGEASDQKINDFIDCQINNLQIRADVIQSVKSCHEKFQTDTVEATTVHTAYAFTHPDRTLTPIEIREILIELASPLVGYLGRVKDTDRFYYLRDLQITPTTGEN